MRKEFTLTEMASISLPFTRKDPLTFHQYPNFYITNKPFDSPHPKTPPPEDPPSQIKSVPTTHYIENRFHAYNQAKIFNRPLFTQLNKAAESNPRSISNPRFQTSHYPKVPLSKELNDKFETINSFREILKKPSKPSVIVRPSSNLSITKVNFKSREFLSDFKLWEKIKREKKKRTGENVGESRSASRNATRTASYNKRARLKGELINTYDSISSGMTPMAPCYNLHKAPISPNCIPNFESYVDQLNN